MLLNMQKTLGNKWSKISKLLLGRTENAVKVRWKSLDRAAKRAAKAAKSSGNKAANSKTNVVRHKTGSSGASLHNSLKGVMTDSIGEQRLDGINLDDDLKNNVGVRMVNNGDDPDYSAMFNSNDEGAMQVPSTVPLDSIDDDIHHSNNDLMMFDDGTDANTLSFDVRNVFADD